MPFVICEEYILITVNTSVQGAEDFKQSFELNTSNDPSISIGSIGLAVP